MKLKNKSSREIAVVDPFLEHSVTVAAGELGEFSDPAAVDLLASFPSDWESVQALPVVSAAVEAVPTFKKPKEK